MGNGRNYVGTSFEALGTLQKKKRARGEPGRLPPSIRTWSEEGSEGSEGAKHYLVRRSEPTGGPSGPNFRVFRSTYSWEFRNEFLRISERDVGYSGNDGCEL